MPVVPLARRAGTRTAVLAALTLAGTTLSGGPAVAQPVPGDNGDVKIHASQTAADDRRNDPRVCDFYLAAFDFEPGERVNWTIQALPEVPARTGTVTLDQTGAGRSPLVDLPNGQYKLTWLTDQAHGAGKFKVFQVDCPTSKPSPVITPNGGAPAGGGGLARAEAFTPVAGAAAVGLAAVAGTVWFRLRRRPDGPA